jgi:hypothetical protein
VQGVVLSVTLFLVAISQIIQNFALPTKIFEYADDWVIYRPTVDSQQNCVLGRKHRVQDITTKNYLHAHMSTKAQSRNTPGPSNHIGWQKIRGGSRTYNIKLETTHH